MDNVSLILSGLLSLALVILIAPGILALNRGRVLHNIALWVAIFLGLALIYKHFGPFPTAYQRGGLVMEQTAPTQENMQKEETETPATPDLSDGYNPPQEE